MLLRALRDSPRFALALVGGVLLLAAGSGALLVDTVQVRFHRDISRIVLDRNWNLLDRVRRQAGIVSDSLRETLESGPAPSMDQPYIVVSIADRRLWYKRGDDVLFTTRVAVGSGKTLVKRNGRDEYKFDTPRGRLVVQSKDVAPVWVPPDWHFLEVAKKDDLGVIMMKRGDTILDPVGGDVMVAGNNVVRRFADGRIVPYDFGEGHEIIVGKDIVVPPYGTNQRRYIGVLGWHRLNLGDGYALHGTDDPASIGKAVSHGCIRLRNEDIDYLWQSVPVGTPVFIY
jgi:hypothetical protein